MYFGGQIGGTFPSDLSDVKGVGALSGTTLSDLDSDNSVVYGGKVGYFLTKVPWLGFETEVYTATPDIPAQTTTVTGFSLPSADSRVTTWATSLMVRYPGKMFQPYAGVGLGVYFAHIDGAGFSDSTTEPGLVVNAGARMFVTDRLAVFGEYKYNAVTLEFNDPTVLLQADYSAHHIVGGLSFHFPDL